MCAPEPVIDSARPSPQSSTPVSVSSADGSLAPSVSSTSPLDGTACGPAIDAVGGALETTTVAVYSAAAVVAVDDRAADRQRGRAVRRRDGRARASGLERAVAVEVVLVGEAGGGVGGGRVARVAEADRRGGALRHAVAVEFGARRDVLDGERRRVGAHAAVAVDDRGAHGLRRAAVGRERGGDVDRGERARLVVLGAADVPAAVVVEVVRVADARGHVGGGGVADAGQADAGRRALADRHVGRHRARRDVGDRQRGRGRRSSTARPRRRERARRTSPARRRGRAPAGAPTSAWGRRRSRRRRRRRRRRPRRSSARRLRGRWSRRRPA